jgi:Tfp pilus tip-associated adhesin PilY1
MTIMNKIKRCLCLLLAGLLTFAPMHAYPAFDPVNDDTDIFIANPNATSSRPNVLVIVDNTANWNTPFTNEKNALVQVFNSLNENFNVGLMMMAETGSPNDNVDGGYVRYHVRQMTGQNRTALAQIVNGLDRIGDRSNNAGHGQALYEAYRYFGGLTSIASHGKVKTDKAGTTDPILAPLTGPRALSAPANASTPYNSPIADACAKNFVILISNGPADSNVKELGNMESRIVALTGSNAVIPLTPSGMQGNWSDEMAKYMANADVNSSVPGVQNVITYVVEVNPGTTGQGPAWTAVMKSTAANGKGKYFGVTDDASGAAIVDALTQIFTEIQAVNSVFAATTLPVSVNVRGTNLNQVYIGVFRPDAKKAPRWLGNLKMYNLALIGGQVVLADATNGPPPAVGQVAANAATGFISANARSFWTEPSTFWDFRDASLNGVGGVSDSPDGDLVEKGGAAQQIRLKHPNAENPVGAEQMRRLYTCTTGNVDGILRTCAPGSPLSATPFKDGNEGITAAALQLDTRAVSPLTAFDTKAITSLSDRRAVTISNASAGGVAVTSLSQPLNTTIPLSNLTTATPRQLTALTAAQPNILVRNITTIDKVKGSVVVTTATAHGFTNGQTVVIQGNSVSAFNGTWTVSSAATNTFIIGSTANGPGTGGTATVNAGTTNTTTATATLTNHGFVSGQSVTITGASPAQFNGTFNITVPLDGGGSPEPDRFTYVISSAAGDATGTIMASGNTTTATATRTTAGAPLTAGSSVVIFGASPSGYNGSKMVLANPAPTTTTFSYSVAPDALPPNSGSPIYAVQGASTTAVANTTVAHGFADGQIVTISGSDIAGYNGAFPITVLSPTSFSYDAGAVLPAATGTIVASTGTQTEVTATLANHGFSVGDQIIIEGGSQALHNGTFTVKAVPNVNTFTYDNAPGNGVSPTGSHTVRPVNSRVFATVVNHGYGAAGTTREVFISGATPTAYNGTYTVTVLDADTFTYQLSPLSTAPGPNTSVAATASVKTTTARATSIAHGFANGSVVQVAGATPAAFNGTFTVSNVTANSFTYTIASEQGDASGTITATQAGGSSAERTNIIRWVRGEDNFEPERTAHPNKIRPSVHGDVLHSRPAVINYSRFSANDPLDPAKMSDDDVFVFYGANDGIFRAVKGGYAVPPGDSSGLTPGQEAWGFIPEEFFGNLKRLRNNSPIISSSFKKPYFADGPIAVYTNDANNNGKLGDTGDTVNLYIAMRRGGRLIYSLDVNNPVDPKFRWKISNATPGFAELGQTWSQTTVVPEGLQGYPNPVLVFGGGYDPLVEDIPSDQITSLTATSVTTASGTFTRSMGRAIYVVDAITGALVWSAGGSNSNGTFNLTVPGMDFAIPSDITVIKNESGGAINRAYVGDTGGNVWRIDFRSSGAGNNLNGTTVTKIAAVGNHSVPSGRRKFMHAPDVVGQLGFDAILIGSGDREHPFDTSVVNRFYMFKDKGDDSGPVTGTDPVNAPVIVESAMFDATSNCIQDCPDPADRALAQNALNAASGWFITLLTGEKVVGNAVTIGGTTFFATNQPETVASDETCSNNLGVARQYAIAAADATATLNLDGGELTGADRSQIIAGGGYLPPPTHIITQPTGSTGITEVVCTGVFCITPETPTFQSRLRKFWYREVDQR